MKTIKQLPILAILLVTACATTATGNAAKVRMTSNPDAVKDCKFLGNVEASDHWHGGTMGQGIAENNATVAMKNKTSAMGGNTVLLARSTTNTSGSSQLGEAYACPVAPVQ